MKRNAIGVCDRLFERMMPMKAERAFHASNQPNANRKRRPSACLTIRQQRIVERDREAERRRAQRNRRPNLPEAHNQQSTAAHSHTAGAELSQLLDAPQPGARLRALCARQCFSVQIEDVRQRRVGALFNTSGSRMANGDA